MNSMSNSILGLYVNHGIKIVPTGDKNMYANEISGSGVFEIKIEDVIKVEGNDANMSGMYIIGVYSTEDVDFIINVQTF